MSALNLATPAVTEDQSTVALVDKFINLHKFLAAYQEEYDNLKSEIMARVNQNTLSVPVFLRGSYGNKIEFSKPVETKYIPLTPAEVAEVYGYSVFKPDVKLIEAFERLNGGESILKVKVGGRRLLMK